MSPQQFGGPWTERKLNALTAYLNAYLQIFTRNDKAAKFTRHYVDAFAGSGTRAIAEEPGAQHLPEIVETVGYMDGSVHRVLSLEKDFHHYHFVEKNRKYAEELRRAIQERYPDRAPRCNVINEDANAFLEDWCARLKGMDRGVVFLDPYGMSVRWSTIEQLAATRKVDLWMLFPSSSVIRMLPRAGKPEEAWANRLTELFGTRDWEDEFYKPGTTPDMFGDDRVERVVSVEAVANYLLERLRRIFAGVSEHPIPLTNSKGAVLFLLVFAVGNPRGKKPALDIAGYIGQHC